MPKQKLNIAEEVNAFFELKQKFVRIEQSFKEKQKRFYSVMDASMTDDSIEVDRTESTELGQVLTVTRVQKTTVKWNADKLEKTDAAEAVEKTITINNWQGFVKYLKSLGGNPQEVKKFLSVSKQVNTKCLDELEALGAITREELEGCYTATVAPAYYLVKERQK